MPVPNPHPERDSHVAPSPSPSRRLLAPPTLAVLMALSALAAGCGDGDAPVLRAAGVGFAESELLGLGEDRRMLLGELTALAVAVSDSALETVGRPWAAARERDRLWQLLQAERALDSAGVGDDILQARYRTDPQWELTVRHLLILSPRYESETTRVQARTKAQRALARITAGEEFAEVAAELSEEPGAEGRQGLLSPGRDGAWVSEFWNAALSLEPGEISGVVETQYGFHVLRLEDRRVVPFEEARTGILLDAARMLAALDPSAETAPLPPGLELNEEALRSLASGAVQSAVVARWQEDSLSVDTLLDALAALPYPRWRTALHGDDPGDLRREVEAVVRSVHAARQAAAAGLTVSDAWRAATLRAWTDRAAEWGRLLGFTPGMNPEALRGAALNALGATGQNTTVARDEVRRDAGPLLHRAYAIETVPPAGA